MKSRTLTSCILPSLMWMNAGILPRRSSRVCSFTAAFVVRKRRPGEDRETKIDGRGIQRVDRLVQIHAKGLVDIQLASHRNQALSERGIDTPVAHLIRIRERAARNPTAYSHVIELVALRPQARLDVPKALAVGELREGQAEKLLETREALDLVLAAVRVHAATKRRER